ncbi:MAG TPA: alanine racemase [Candidatus Rubrimentiphilum sp.]|nr:alanine racemase [Candidatus Rubrimentiphilum sp.]
MIGALRISIAALRHNARTLRDLAAPAKAAFVVKSNAYGHGLVRVALAIEEFADAICVYAVEEGLALREAGVKVPIMVLGPTPVEHLEEALARQLQITLWDATTYLDTVAGIARRHNSAFRVHMKVDTGIRRLGLDPRDAPKAIERALKTPGIEVAGIFSHLASAEDLDSPFTLGQLQTLESVLNAVHFDGKSHAPLRHIAASAAAMLWPQTRLDLVRFGIALYGLWPSKETRASVNGGFSLQPALSFESRVIAVRKVEPGTLIGYGGSYKAPRAMRIGVVPLGYADGIPRLLSNRGAFLVAGQRCPIAGRVCMNMTMIDLGATQARPGDPVVLIGNQGDASVTADDWADWAETINYEIVARLPSELTRIYDER